MAMSQLSVLVLVATLALLFTGSVTFAIERHVGVVKNVTFAGDRQTGTVEDRCALITCASYPNAATTCQAGKCNVTCSPGFADCNRILPDDGCEVNVCTDNLNCGICGKQCPAFSACSKGVCNMR